MHNYLRLVAVAVACVVTASCTHETVSPTAQLPATPTAATPPQPIATPAPLATEPDIATMQRAVQSGKLSAPVDVLFRLRDDIAADRPVRIDFAVSPRVAGENLRFELVESNVAMIESADRNLAVQKADASGTYRKSVTVTPRAGLTKLQALVYMNVGTDTFAGVYTIPVGPAAASIESNKKDRKDVQR